jgi:hypothetical protein
MRTRDGGWKEKNFFPKEGTGIWTQGGKRKHIFVKDDIPRDIHSISRNMKALITFVRALYPRKTHFLDLYSSFDCYKDANEANKHNQKL